MEEKIIFELQELRRLFSYMIGTADLPAQERFSVAALDKAAQAYTAMTMARGEWVAEEDFEKYLGPCPHRAGNFLREHFDFRRAIKKGHYYLFYKPDLIAFGQELKTRNIDLKRYKELLDDQAEFSKKLSALQASASKNLKAKSFQVPAGLNNITTSEIPKPDATVIKAHLAQLKLSFKEEKLSEYIDVYKGTYAMVKHMYFLEKYLEPGLKRRCQKWCEAFNYANHALEIVTGKKEKFVEADRGTIEL